VLEQYSFSLSVSLLTKGLFCSPQCPFTMRDTLPHPKPCPRLAALISSLQATAVA
jgi:hypothetical protein